MKNLSFTLVFAFFALTAFAQYDPKALETLDAMSKKYKSIEAFEANIVCNMTNEIDKVNEEFKGKITVKGDKFVLVLPEQEIINNGNTQWTYLPEAKEVNIDTYDPNSDDVNPTKILDMYKKGYKYISLGEKTVDGVQVEEIDLVPDKKDAQYFKIKMMIAKKDKSIHSWTMFNKAGDRFKYTITKFNPSAKVDDSFFAFDVKKHPDVLVNDLR
ncbi:MAG TPA: outer membrane lipoprotein carrier protein LolA [Cyclobacteriaceae bacterium]|nr:outer membrane lipoprotein carrier protein LolA [Cyclobacteriaceae bacterium]